MEPLSSSVIVGITEALAGQSIERMSGAGTTIHAAPDVRRAAYVRFQNASSAAQAHIATVNSTIKSLQGLIKSLGTRDWALSAVATVTKAMAEFMGALNEVRLVGNPGPREAAENITSVIGEMASVMGPDASEEHMQACLRLLGELHKEFTLVARLDLEYDRKVRWWQVHLWAYWFKHRKEPDWPGGWPGPDMTTRLEEIKKQAAERAVISP